jgi:hypothetical protein
MKYVAWLSLMLGSLVHADESSSHKNDVILWYEAFNKNDPALLDKILSESWVDIPAAPGQPTGPLPCISLNSGSFLPPTPTIRRVRG